MESSHYIVIKQCKYSEHRTALWCCAPNNSHGNRNKSYVLYLMILKLLARENTYRYDIWDHIFNPIDNYSFEGNKTDIILHIQHPEGHDL